MKKLYPEVETCVKDNTLRIGAKIREIAEQNSEITDGEAWKYITDLCRARITCYNVGEVKEAYNTLEKFNMQRGILKITPRFMDREHDVLIVFDYFHVMICELEIKLHDTYPIQNEEKFIVDIKQVLRQKNIESLQDVFKKKQMELVDNGQMN